LPPKEASHILQFSHDYGPIENTMNILKTVNKDMYLDIIERFHIYKTSKVKPIINEQHVDEYNRLFEILLKHERKLV
jgi:ribosomal protein L31